MKIKLVLASLAVAGLAVSSAVAAPPEGKGKPRAGEGCKPKVTVVLKGTLKSASASSLSVEVKKGNRWGRAYVKAAQPLPIAVNPDTKVRRQGKKTLADLKPEDRVLVQARVCKADLKDDSATPPALTASKVIAHPAQAAEDEEDEKEKKEKDEKDD
jgi:hypothetical protein